MLEFLVKFKAQLVRDMYMENTEPSTVELVFKFDMHLVKV